MWSKQDVEDFLDWQENLVAQVQGGNDERSSH
jgi:hypothetical protein